MDLSLRQHARLVRHVGPAVLILVSFALFGCYTILKHPVTAQEGPEPLSHDQEYYRQNCLDCHADYATYPYGYFYGVYPDYYFEYPRWGYYYAYPWWWDNHWYDAELPDEPILEGESGPRAIRRGALAPPYVHGAPALNTRGGIGGTGYRARTNTPSTGTGSTPGGPTGSDPTRDKKRISVSGKRDGDTSDSDSDSDSSEDTKKKKGTRAKRRGGLP